MVKMTSICGRPLHIIVFVLAGMSLALSSVAAFTGFSRTFRRFVSEGMTAMGTYTTTTGPFTWCLTSCEPPACLVFAWDSASFECRLYSYLNYSATRVPSPYTMTTYYIASDSKGPSGQLVFAGSINGTWVTARTACQNLGGDLASPRSAQFAAMIHTVAGVRDIAVGMMRNLTTTIFQDLQGNIVTDIVWDVNEPTGPTQKYMFLKGGKYFDINLVVRAYHEAACTVP